MPEYQIINSDCVEAMRAMPDNSVDSIVTDPPYELGFMCKSWDASGIAYRVDMWREALRVLKPGGHLLAFSGSRTYHRMTVAIEDAGFEVRDQIMWVYGCLDEQTEVATANGVSPYHKTKVGDLVLCYDAEQGRYSYQPILEIVEYEYSDTAYRLVGDFGEQVVSRNHRCIVERGGVETFQYAETLQREARVPFLEDLPALQRALHGTNERTGYAEQDLQPGVFGGADRGREYGGKASGNSQGENDSLRSVRAPGLEAGRMAAQGNETGMQPAVQRRAARGAVGDARAQGAGGLVGGGRGVTHSQDDWAEQPSLEGWGDVLQAQGAVRESVDQVRALSGGVPADGAQGRVRDGASAAGGAGDGSGTTADRGRAPHQPHGDGQPAVESNVVCDERAAQGVRAWGGHKTAVVRVVPFHYTGKVWCLRVPTGAFVAVRNGVAFPTGNSGFPKSLDVSKAIDKANGRGLEDWYDLGRHIRACRLAKGLTVKAVNAHFGGTALCNHWEAQNQNNAIPPTPEHWAILKDWLGCDPKFDEIVDRAGAPREVVGVQKGAMAGWAMDGTTKFADRDITVPATDAARQWEGWGTALKPAFEPLCVAKKPLTDVAEQDIINANLTILGARLWSMSLANAAESNSPSNPSELSAACVIAQWTADEAISTQAALSEAMGTSPFAWAITTSLSIVTSWRDTLAEISKPGSTSTTATKFDTTIDWKTLSFCLSEITPRTITLGLSHRSGSIAFASPAERYFDAELKRLSAIRALSAIGPAMSLARDNSLDVDAKVKHEPICVARKPIQGTVAANVLAFGTGALNIDGCRVGIADDERAVIDNRSGAGESVEGWGNIGNRAEGQKYKSHDAGRWPANIIHEGSDEVVAMFPVEGNKSTARFFMECKGGYNEECQNQNDPLSDALTAALNSARPNLAAAFALALAVNEALPGGLHCLGLSPAPSTSATLIELRLIGESAMQAIQSIGEKCWHGSKPVKLSLSRNHASVAVHLEPTGTTTITISHWRSDGSAEPVTFSITRPSSEAGAKGFVPFTGGDRFKYCAKASKKDRNEGLDSFTPATTSDGRATAADNAYQRGKTERANTHPTVKPTDLMAYLVRLVTPPGGLVLDPFMGSGSTGKACMREGFRFIGCELSAEYVTIAQARIEHELYGDIL